MAAGGGSLYPSSHCERAGYILDSSSILHKANRKPHTVQFTITFIPTATTVSSPPNLNGNVNHLAGKPVKSFGKVEILT